ncbi:PilW family protein [Angustibacter speluncae]
MSLPELLVTMGLAAIVLTALAAVFVNTMESVRFVTTKTSTTNDARIAMEAMSRSLRVAVIPKGETSALVSAQAGSVEFYASLARSTTQSSEIPTKLRYAYNPTTRCLEETQVVATPRVGDPARPYQWTSAGATKCLIRTNAAPQFSYYTDGRITDDLGATVAPLAVPSGGLALADRQRVVSVRVTIVVQDPGATEVPGTLTVNRVTLVNVQTAASLGG